MRHQDAVIESRSRQTFTEDRERAVRENLNVLLILIGLLFKGELKPKNDFSSFEYLGIVEQLYEVFLNC